MEFSPQPDEPRISFHTKVLAAIVVVAVIGLVIWLPASRRFLLGIGIAVLICVVIGIVVAGILRLWHKHKPVEEENVEHKRPLGLQ